MNGVMIKRFFEEKYPLHLAYDWDNVGLQIGSLNKKVTGILITLDVTKEVIDEAISKECNLIIAHHPMIFKPLKHILSDTYKGAIIEKLIKSDISLYVSHTNYDLGHDGMNTVLANRLNLKNTEVLEFVEEDQGIGKIGDLPKTMTLDEAITYIKTHLEMKHARLITSKPDKKVTKVAISGGSGASHMFEAKRKAADLYITGDISYHQAHDMLQLGLSALDIGHYAEKHFSKALALELKDYGIDVAIYESTIDLDPFIFV